MLRHEQVRKAMTLVELMVAIAIILALATLTALYFPRYQDRESVSRGADQLQGLLLAAKQQARRDGLATGLRFYVEQQSGSTSLNQGRPFCRRIAYVQQPDDLSVGIYKGFDENTTTRAWFSLPSGKKFENPTTAANPPELPVTPGDYLTIDFGGRMWRIKAIGDNYLDVDDNQRALPGDKIDNPGNLAAYNDEPVNYRVRRQPVVVPGEQEIALPENVGIDFGEHSKVTSNDVFSNKWLSRNVQSETTGGVTHCDVLFSPTGALIGDGTSNAQVIFWIRDLTRPNADDILAGHSTLICVQPRTGFIAAHPASSDSDPYAFTKDARSSGL